MKCVSHQNVFVSYYPPTVYKNNQNTIKHHKYRLVFIIQAMIVQESKVYMFYQSHLYC